MDENSIVKRNLAKQFRREMTTGERRLWNAIRCNRIEGLHFRRQEVVLGFFPDFYCHKIGLIIEIDGGIHKETQDYDNEKDRILDRHGILVLRFTNSQVDNDLYHVLNRIRETAISLLSKQEK